MKKEKCFSNTKP